MGRKKKYHTEDERLEAKKRLNRENYLRNKSKIKDNKKSNKKEIAEYQKLYREDNREKLKSNKIHYYLKNKDKFSDYGKQYRLENKEEIRKRKNKYQKDRRDNDPLFKLRCNLSNLIRYGIINNGFKKTNKTEEIIGCTFEEFKEHIESRWEDWMSWDNYGNPKDGVLELNKTWDIDHTIPISSTINEGEVIKLSHYTNLQPLCSYNNRFIKVNN